MLCCAKHIYNNNDLILIQISELQTGFICLNCCITLIDVLFKNKCKLKCPVNSRCLSPQSKRYKAYFFNKIFLMFSFMVQLKK